MGTEKILDFLDRYQDVDIFCFQEVFNGGGSVKAEVEEKIPDKDYKLFSHIESHLPQHVGYFRPALGEHYGLATFVKKDIELIKEEDYFVHKYKGFFPDGPLGLHARNMQILEVRVDNGTVAIINFHGLWTGKGKMDNEDRITQSNKVVEYIKNHISSEIVLVGDFNLVINGKSLDIVENAGLDNLIKKYNIPTTRTSLYEHRAIEPYADYVFVSPGIQVEDFRVLPDVVSDHVPLFISFDLR